MSDPIVESASELRQRVKNDLSRDFLQPQKWRLIWFLPIAATIVTGWWLLAQFDLAWYWCLLLSVVVGNAYGSMGFLAHEVSHGSMGLSKKWRNLVAGVGF